jgi:hypothetical protein
VERVHRDVGLGERLQPDDRWRVVARRRRSVAGDLRAGARPHDPSETGADDASTARGLHLGDALQDWESEGGAIA